MVNIVGPSAELVKSNFGIFKSLADHIDFFDDIEIHCESRKNVIVFVVDGHINLKSYMKERDYILGIEKDLKNFLNLKSYTWKISDNIFTAYYDFTIKY